MKYILVMFHFIALLVLQGCKNDGSCSTCPGVETFAFRINVTDGSRRPVAGTGISAWNHLSLPFPQAASFAPDIRRFSENLAIADTCVCDTVILRQNWPNPFNPTTTIEFSLSESSRVSVKVFNLLGGEVATLLNRQVLSKGIEDVDFDGSALSNGVFKVQLFTKSLHDSSSSTSNPRGTIYICLWKAPDPLQTMIGFTSSNGSFETRDKLFFPNLFTLPPLIYTTIDPQPLGTFFIRDTISIVLTDTLAHTNQTFQRVLQNGMNQFDLVLPSVDNL